MQNPPLPSPQVMCDALVNKDSRFEGIFFAAVKTTGIFCRPTCTARKPKPENVEFFTTPKEALACGYRPCKVCQPLSPDFRNLLAPPKGLVEKIAKAIDLYGMEWIFIHLDSENDTIQARQSEVEKALDEIPQSLRSKVFVTVVPVKMMEAWLLLDEAAIRKAAGNPNGNDKLSMPKTKDVERLPAKDVLFQLLRTASGLTGRRLDKFNTTERTRRYLVAEYLENFAELAKLPSYQYFERQVELLSRQFPDE